MRRAPTGRLLTRLLVGTLVPTVLALGTFGILAHEVARRVLEDELGRRLALAAAGTAGMILPEQVVALADGNTASLTYANVRRKLEVARERFDVRRVALVSRELIALGDTEGRIAIGAEAHELGADRLELARATSGHPAASPLFIGHDRLPYKRGYAAVGEAAGSPGVVGLAVVEASADYFVPLGAFRRQLILGGILALAIVLGVTVVMARRVSGPVVRLASAAERIGRGDLDHPVPVATRDEVGFLAQTLDEMRAALKARDERLQMMLAGIAHEVRNPLGGLELYAGLLRDALGDRPERLDEVGRIEREVQYLKVVVTEFLDYARRAPPEIARVRIFDLLSEVRDLASAAGAGADIDIDADRALTVQADAGQLRRALLNLARNAVAAATRAHPGGTGRVSLRARSIDGGGVRIEVDDDGAGVDPAVREKIFAPFFTTREKGTGLGLAFVREIVIDHGSEVHVGDAPGGGARFWFELGAGEARTSS